jgi:DNA-binding response OmpR family regulator
MMRGAMRPPGGVPGDRSALRREEGLMRYLFADYCLDTQCYELHQAGVPIPLSPKVFQVLAYLLEH